MKMRKCLAILLVALIIGQTPAYAVQYGEINQTVDMTVRGKGVESQINETFNMTVEQNSSVETNTVTELNTAGNNNSMASTNTTVRENIGTQNSTIPQKNTSGIVMQTRAYTCGPAALATVLQNMGFNVTEQDLKVLAGTDTSGTTMYGLARAAQSKGLSAAGIELSVDDLKPNHIVHVVIDGTAHFSVVREITETSVKLADPKLGNIEMTREKFSEIFTGHALVISNPNNLTQVNGTDQSTEDTESEDTDSGELEKLASEDMLTIQGVGGVNRVVWRWWGYRIYICNINTQNIAIGKFGVAALAAYIGTLGIKSAPIANALALALTLSALALQAANIRNTGVIVRVTHPVPPLWKPLILGITPQRR